jgi:hypothetical protein
MMRLSSTILPFIALLVVFFGMRPQQMFGQDLSEQDKRLLDNIRQQLNPDQQQMETITRLVSLCSAEVAALEAEKKKIQQESNDEEFLQTQLLVLNQQIKDSREFRDAGIEVLLRPEQLAVYKSKIKPDKPQVLHFGLHDKANCNICIK